MSASPSTPPGIDYSSIFAIESFTIDKLLGDGSDPSGLPAVQRMTKDTSRFIDMLVFHPIPWDKFSCGMKHMH